MELPEVLTMIMWTVGVDLGKKATHRAVVLDENCRKVDKEWIFTTSAEELDRLLAELATLAPAGTVFRFVMEPTPAWQTVGLICTRKAIRCIWPRRPRCTTCAG